MKLHKKFTFKWRAGYGVIEGALCTAEREWPGFRVKWTGCYNGAVYQQSQFEKLVKDGDVQEIRPILSAEDIASAPEGTKITFLTRLGYQCVLVRSKPSDWRSDWRCEGAPWSSEDVVNNFVEEGCWVATDIEYPETPPETKATAEDATVGDSTIGTVFKFTTPLDKNGDMKYEVEKTAENTWKCSWQSPSMTKRATSVHLLTSQEVSEHIKGGWNVYSVNIVPPMAGVPAWLRSPGLAFQVGITEGYYILDNGSLVQVENVNGDVIVSAPASDPRFSDRNDKAWAQKTGCALTYKPDGCVVLDAGWVRVEVAPENDLAAAKIKFARFLGKE